jgi:hypothetical protein
MRIALVDTTERRQHYSVALLKLGAWVRERGDECSLYEGTLPEPGSVDEIWLSTVFSFDMPRALDFARAARDRADRVVLGGLSATLFPDYFTREEFEVVRGLVPEAENMAPAYDLLPEPPTYAITHTSRGCPRSCDFCMVPRLEPKFEPRANWTRDVPEDVDEIRFYDNNVLALPPKQLAEVVEKTLGLVDDFKVSLVDFNQGLDARLLTDRSADLLASLPIAYPRFAFDGMQEDGHYQRAVRMMAERGVSEFRTYVLYNHTGTPEEFYFRIRSSVELQDELRAAGYKVRVKSYPMKFAPVAEPDLARDHVGYRWRRSDRDGVRMILSQCSGGTMYVAPSSLEEFEYWWGRTEEEFATLIRFPQLRLLLDRRRGARRIDRARIREAAKDSEG